MENIEVRKRQAALFYQFSKLGSKYGLSFSSQELLQHRLIGLDGIRQMILVFEIMDNAYDWYLINLKDVKSCAVKKIFGSIDAGELNTHQVNYYLEVILLEFCFYNDLQTVALPFYIRLKNAPEEIPVLENKAKAWEVILNKMLIKEKKRA